MTLWHLFKMQMQLWLMIGLPLSILSGVVLALWIRYRKEPKKISVSEFRSRLKKLLP